MKTHAILALALVALVSQTGRVDAQAFSMTPEEFRNIFDNRARENTLNKNDQESNTIRACRQTDNRQVCTFNDKGFQNSIQAFKKLNVLNSRFTQKLSLTLEIANGKVSKVFLEGDRGDPLNLIRFVGAVINIMQVLEPDVADSDGKSLALATELGLMRGDNDPSIGSPAIMLKPYAAVGCLSLPSKIATAEFCQWEPRP